MVSNWEKNQVHQTRYFKLEFCKNQVQIDRGKGQREKLSEIKSTLVEVALLGQVYTFFCISYEFMNIRGNIMLCIFSMHFENVPALQSLINQILLYSYRKVCAHFLIQLFDLSERRRSAGKKGLQGRRNRGSMEGPCPPGFMPPPHCVLNGVLYGHSLEIKMLQ